MNDHFPLHLSISAAGQISGWFDMYAGVYIAHLCPPMARSPRRRSLSSSHFHASVQRPPPAVTGGRSSMGVFAEIWRGCASVCSVSPGTRITWCHCAEPQHQKLGRGLSTVLRKIPKVFFHSRNLSHLSSSSSSSNSPQLLLLSTNPSLESTSLCCFFSLVNCWIESW
jgi:hypothetical protein